MKNSRAILYSHGFGTRKDARGMFIDIAALFPDREHILFDYNEIIDATTLRVPSLFGQAETLRKVVAGIDTAERTIDFITHSQGAVVAAMVCPTIIRKTLCIAPPPSFEVERFIDAFRDRTGAVVDMKGESRVPRKDGTISLVPASYWESLRNTDPIAHYNQFAKHTELVFITGNQDDVFSSNEFFGIDPKVRIISIDGDHNFSEVYRRGLLETAGRELA